MKGLWGEDAGGTLGSVMMRNDSNRGGRCTDACSGWYTLSGVSKGKQFERLTNGCVDHEVSRDFPWGFLHDGVCGNGFIGLRRVGVESIDLESRLDGVDYRRHRSGESLELWILLCSVFSG